MHNAYYICHNVQVGDSSNLSILYNILYLILLIFHFVWIKNILKLTRFRIYCKTQYLIPSGLDVLSRLLLGRGSAGKRKKRKRKEKVLKSSLQNCFCLPNILFWKLVLLAWKYRYMHNLKIWVLTGSVDRKTLHCYFISQENIASMAISRRKLCSNKKKVLAKVMVLVLTKWPKFLQQSADRTVGIATRK